MSLSRDETPADGGLGTSPFVPELEEDETIAPRPEEVIADELRARPDVADHSELSGDGAA